MKPLKIDPTLIEQLDFIIEQMKVLTSQYGNDQRFQGILELLLIALENAKLECQP